MLLLMLLLILMLGVLLLLQSLASHDAFHLQALNI
jgi:hypothetical protein